MRTWVFSGLLGAMACLAAALMGEVFLGPPRPSWGKASAAEPAPDLVRRLGRADRGANDIVIALFWDGKVPLELTCIGPNGEPVRGEQPPLEGKGVREEDGEGPGHALTVAWPRGTAPQGTYQIVVSAPAGDGKEAPPFVCAAQSGSGSQVFSGLAARGESQTVGLFAFRRVGSGPWLAGLQRSLGSLLVAVGLCLGLLAAKRGRPKHWVASVCVAVLLLAGAALAGVATGVGAAALWEALGKGEEARALARGAAWLLLGAALGAMAVDGGWAWRRRGAMLGAAGGALGALLAESADLYLVGPASRMLAPAALGACVGMALGPSLVRPVLALRWASGRVLPLFDGVILRAPQGAGSGAPLPTVARVGHKPGDPSVLGMENLSPAEWVAALEDGSTVRVSPGRCLRLSRGMLINFGPAVGEVC